MTIPGSVWVPIGPSPIAQSGRQDNGLTTAIAVNPNNPNIIYQGTAGGGVWRTQNGGATWTPIFDRQISLGVGEHSALAIDPNDTSVIYVGTSGRGRVGAATPAGLFKSTDGGASFVQVGSGYPAGNTGNATQFFNDWINVIIVDPADSQTIYLASATGVFRSTNGGLDWFRGTDNNGVNINGDVRSLVLDTSSPAGNARILYAGITNTPPTTNDGVFQSTDGGQNWAPICNAAITPAVAGALTGGVGQVLVALAPATNPQPLAVFRFFTLLWRIWARTLLGPAGSSEASTRALHGIISNPVPGYGPVREVRFQGIASAWPSIPPPPETAWATSYIWER
jgi:hypothetical protein